MCNLSTLLRSAGTFLIFAALVTAAQGHGPKQCAQFNEYCQTHRDCCSNSCLTYLYRCTRNHGIFPYPFFGSDYPVAGTLDDILELNFGSGVRVSNGAQQAPQRPIGFSSRFGGFDGENELEQSTEAQTVAPTTTSAEITTTIAATDATVDADAKGKTETRRAAAGDAVTTTSIPDAVAAPTPATVAQCKEIGAKCYSNDECCTLRCHGFLHQCVT